MKDVETILRALRVFPGTDVILYSADAKETVTFQDVVDYVQGLQDENERLNDMKFTQEHCDLYEENEWLKDMIRSYMNGEIVNEDIFAQQVEDMRQLRKYTAEQYHDMMNEVIEKRDYVEGYAEIGLKEENDEIYNKITGGVDNGK